ncbi:MULTISPECIES: shikimate kinase [Brevibacillus]|uniref:shikimate kinase n=1 Tax=Brevibacillus TaxID=55080 RepID=UPI000271A24F|nr:MULTISPECIES: shikimate kinase [Brevibacillus]ELK43720.1 shikimate kinase [Brevibacillus agri BAB-2500]EJL41353.1 shikimate kinase [Brevibacillus sp. CF112]MBY0051495.1 shikimate kinase [Brevibacillus agri]MCG5249842.1 shikimate kinase [Brevibacillus agri]MDN4091790.1 shikimate kinase [Brevibacillus agri]
MKNLILVGFMGTGKTTVGVALADSLGIAHHDLDAAIIEKEGCSIPELFARHGETYFRDAESRLLSQLLDDGPQVLTTGGGAVLRKQNVEVMLAKGTVIALYASEEELIRRLENDTSRPLLSGGVAERVKTLMAERAGAYDFAPIQVDTTGKSLEAIVDEIKAQVVESAKDGKQ